jgi:quercetin dioxygenase-like cupin family protein
MIKAALSLAAVTLALAPATFTPVAFAQNAPPAATVTPVASHELPNVPGKKVTAVRVHYQPGGKSGAHKHAGSVLAIVLDGEIRSENSATGPVKVYKAGESFFEPPGSTHLVSENASTTNPATLLAIFVADAGAELTVYDNK